MNDQKKPQRPTPVKKVIKKIAQTIEEGPDYLTQEKAYDAFRIEWSVRYFHLTPRDYLMSVKGLSNNQASKVLRFAPAVSWQETRRAYQNEILLQTSKRHIDLIVEAQGHYIQASKLGLAKAMELLAKFEVEAVLDPKTGQPLLNKRGKPIYRVRAMDLLNIMKAIETAQTVYRKAMGLRDDEGLQQVVNLVQADVVQIQPQGVAVEKARAELSYDEIMAFIEEKRKRLAEAKNDTTDGV